MSETAEAAFGAAGEVERPMRRVRPWIAAILSLIWTGLGHFYARRTGRALGWIIALSTLTVAALVSVHLLEERGLLVALPSVLLFSVMCGLDAFIAANARRHAPRGGRVRLLGYAGVFVLAVGLANALYPPVLPLRSFYIPSESMVPTLAPHDRMLVRMRSPICELAIRRGDIVLVTAPPPADRERLVRRVVGLAGDRIRIDERGLEVNGARITGPVDGAVERISVRGLRVRHDVAQERVEGTGPWTVYATDGWGQAYVGTVPEGHVFALGDNRAFSRDDRFQGPTPLDAIVGKPLRVTFTLGEGDFWQWRDLRVRDAPSCATS